MKGCCKTVSEWLLIDDVERIEIVDELIVVCWWFGMDGGCD